MGCGLSRSLSKNVENWLKVLTFLTDPACETVILDIYQIVIRDDESFNRKLTN